MALLSHPLIAAIILLGVLVLIHELGHFLVGKWCGIGVEIFSIGFGPQIFGFTRNGTSYRISWIPLGGYVKFVGSTAADEIPTDYDYTRGIEFFKASVFKRSLVLLAGPMANFLFAVLAYAVLGFSGISHPPPLIGEILDGSPAQQAGLHHGDRVIKIENQPIHTWKELETAISSSPGKTLQLVVERREGGQTKDVTIQITPEAVSAQNMMGQNVTRGRTGIALGQLPAIVTVLQKNSLAGQAGLQTGDEIVSVKAASWNASINSYPEFLDALTRAQNEKLQRVSLQVRAIPAPPYTSPNDPLQKADNPGPFRSVELEMPKDTMPGSVSLSHRGKAIAKQLGLTDAQVTVAASGQGLEKSILRGDVLLQWNGESISDVFKLRELLTAQKSPDVHLRVLRNFEPTDLDIKIEPVDVDGPVGKVTIFPLSVIFWGQLEDPSPWIESYPNPLEAIGYGLRETARQTGVLLVVIGKLVTGEAPLKALGGPMLIAKVAGDSAKLGWQAFLTTACLISVNLGLLNLFPIPVLDGGHLVLLGMEGLRRRPLSELAIENFQKVGFVMVMALVVLATYNDLSRFWKSMLQTVVGVFQ